jgi:outer membrane lipoprotein-sorting protein
MKGLRLKMKNKKIIFILLILLVIIFLIIIFKNMTKKSKSGNNMDSQEIVDYILNINSYLAKVEVTVNSNKNTNKYILLQEYNTENGCIQEVLEPNNIAGVKIIIKDNNLTIENTNLNLQTIFENYQGLEDNSLDLINFINDYKINSSSNFEEENGEIIMNTTENNNNKYLKNKILYINKENIIPTKLIIKDNNQNTTLIIKYNEIELN